jgi:hypothetical protein
MEMACDLALETADAPPEGYVPGAPRPGPLADTEINWTFSGASPWPEWRPIFDLAIEALPAIKDDVAADLILLLVGTIADLLEELRAVRLVQSMTLEHAHQQEVEVRRLRDQRTALFDILRAIRAERRAK